MKRVITTAAALVFCLVGAACDKSNEPKPEDPVAKNGTTSASATVTPQPVTIDDSDLSTPADFEESAEKAIDAKNYKAELTTIEADIGKE